MRLFRDKKGAAVIEYSLLAALISVGAISAVGATGGKVQATFCSVAKAFPLAGGSCNDVPPEPEAPDPYEDPSTPEYAAAQQKAAENTAECQARPGYFVVEGSQGRRGSVTCGFKFGSGSYSDVYGMPGL